MMLAPGRLTMYLLGQLILNFNMQKNQLEGWCFSEWTSLSEILNQQTLRQSVRVCISDKLQLIDAADLVPPSEENQVKSLSIGNQTQTGIANRKCIDLQK